MKASYKAMPKGKFAPQNREIKQSVVRTSAMGKVQTQDARTANTSAAIFKKQKDNTVPTGKSMALAGAKKSPYRFAHGKNC